MLLWEPKNQRDAQSLEIYKLNVCGEKKGKGKKLEKENIVIIVINNPTVWDCNKLCTVKFCWITYPGNIMISVYA